MPDRFWQHYLLTLIMLFAVTRLADAAPGAAQSSVSPLAPRKFVERVAAGPRPVSGVGVVVGVQTEQEPVRVETDNLAVWIPAGKWEALRVTLTAWDASYEAEAEYDLPAEGPARVNLRIPTANPSVLKSLYSDQLAVLAEGLEKRGTDPSTTFVAGWNNPGRPRRVIIYLNTRGWDTRLYTQAAPSGTPQEKACLENALAGALAFDKTCTLDIAASDTIVSSRIARQRFDTKARPVQLTIKL